MDHQFQLRVAAPFRDALQQTRLPGQVVAVDAAGAAELMRKRLAVLVVDADLPIILAHFYVPPPLCGDR
jgi:hypothetical protein